MRSLEFDGMGGDLAKFILEEVLPAVEQRGAPDGRKIVLSTNPDDRAAGGMSTGGIWRPSAAMSVASSCAFALSSVWKYRMVGRRGMAAAVRRSTRAASVPNWATRRSASASLIGTQM